MSFSFMFLNTVIFGSAPASIKAFAKSYSQFVPGNTGINTFGFAIFMCGFDGDDIFIPFVPLYNMFSILLGLLSAPPFAFCWEYFF